MGIFPITLEGRLHTAALAVAFAAPGATNTKGAWVQAIAATPFDVRELWLSLQPPNGNSGIDCLADIGIGGAGSEQVLIPNIFCTDDGNAGSSIYSIYSDYARFPVAIPKNTRIAARYQRSAAPTYEGNAFLLLVGGGFRAPEAPATYLDIGTNTGSSTGTTCTSGSAGVYGGWAQLTGSLSRTIRGLVIAYGRDAADANHSTITCNIGIGAAASEVGLIEVAALFRPSTSGVIESRLLGMFPVTIPAATRIAARIKSSATTSDTALVAVYGMI